MPRYHGKAASARRAKALLAGYEVAYKSWSEADLALRAKAIEERRAELTGRRATADESEARLKTIRDEVRRVEINLEDAKKAGFSWLGLKRDPAATLQQQQLEGLLQRLRAREVTAQAQAQHDADARVAGEREIRNLAAEAEANRAARQKIRDIRDKAIVAAAQGKSRLRAAAVRRSELLPDQCPYCQMISTQYEYDHIIPIARGGLSEPRNMIFVCLPCNRVKRDNTLFEFCEMRRLDFVEIARRLRKIGKSV